MRAVERSAKIPGAEPPAKDLKIGEVSKLSGVGIEALRFYEKQGLLGKPGRTRSGYRLYAPEVLERLEFIKRAQVLGFSLSEIARIISHKEAGESPCGQVRAIVRRRLLEIDERIRRMHEYRNELAAALESWDQSGDLDGHVCGLIETANISHGPPEGPILKRGTR
jgi:DNA-binding transcriptional MerR regulator